jgi:hypothetical protein
VKERRKTPRTKERLKVLYGQNELDQSGFTADVSIGGLFVVSMRLFKVGARMHLHVMGKIESFFAEGLVVRLKEVPATLRRIERQGMGVRFLNPAEVVPIVVPKALRQMDFVCVHCATTEQAEQILAEQLSRSVLVVAVSDPPPAANTMIEFELELAFHPEKIVIEGQGRVLQVIPALQGQEGKRAVIEVHNALQVQANFATALKFAKSG